MWNFNGREKWFIDPIGLSYLALVLHIVFTKLPDRYIRLLIRSNCRGKKHGESTKPGLYHAYGDYRYLDLDAICNVGKQTSTIT